MFAAAAPELERAAAVDDLARGLAKLLSNARDPHVVVKYGSTVLRTDPATPKPNIAIAAIKKHVSGLTPRGRCLAIGRVEDTIAYVLINGLEKGRCDDLVDQFAAAYASLRDTTGMIIDLRGNQGGDEVKAQAIAGHFVDKPLPYAKSEVRDAAAPGGFRPAQTRTLQPVAGVERYSKPLEVLMGPSNISSCESLLLMLRGAGARLIGERSRGSSGNPQPVDLGNGVTVLLPSWRALQIDGTPIEGNGLTPDVEVAHVETPDLADPTLTAGIAAARAAAALPR
ncbi:MAG: S41 family peptidase, partial [Candidatus Rokuibacteriota bacterium]